MSLDEVCCLNIKLNKVSVQSTDYLFDSPRHDEEVDKTGQISFQVLQNFRNTFQVGSVADGDLIPLVQLPNCCSECMPILTSRTIYIEPHTRAAISGLEETNILMASEKKLSCLKKGSNLARSLGTVRFLYAASPLTNSSRRLSRLLIARSL